MIAYLYCDECEKHRSEGDTDNYWELQGEIVAAPLSSETTHHGDDFIAVGG